jgi:multidrug efflux pump subunit AcrB
MDRETKFVAALQGQDRLSGTRRRRLNTSSKPWCRSRPTRRLIGLAQQLEDLDHVAGWSSESKSSAHSASSVALMRIGLITIPPNVIPLVVTFGYMGLRGFDLNAGNVIVFTISLGIAVDNTIHYILRFREEYNRDPDMDRATWKTLIGKGQPMCLSTFLTVIGLAVLLLSDFVPTRRFAELSIVTLIGALIGALFLLPACVAVLWKEPAVPALSDAASTRRDGTHIDLAGQGCRELQQDQNRRD